jgi:deoxyribonuclease IV
MLNIYNLGFHCPFSGSVYDTLEYATNNGITAVQFFMGSPYSYTRSKITEQDIQKSKALLKRFPVNVFTHFPYVLNLCGSKDCLAWKCGCEEKDDEKPTYDTQTNKTINALKGLEYEINTISKLGGGVVIHPGCFKNRKEGLLTISKSINKINFVKEGLLLLENSAGQGDSLATTLQEICLIIENVYENKRGNIGVCIDTCHLFAFGEYDISKPKEVSRFFKEFQEKIGLNRLKLIHLNDSQTPLGSRKDRHASIGQGYIWKEDTSSLVELVILCTQNNIPMLLETGTNDIPFILNVMNGL